MTGSQGELQALAGQLLNMKEGVGRKSDSDIMNAIAQAKADWARSYSTPCPFDNMTKKELVQALELSISNPSLLREAAKKFNNGGGL